MGAVAEGKSSRSPKRVIDRSISRSPVRRHSTQPTAVRPRSARANASSKAAVSRSASTSARRRLLVFSGLVATITFTGALLLAMQPAPLRPDTVKTLMSVTTEAQVQDLLKTQVPVAAGRWQYLYIHHGQPTVVQEPSRSPGESFKLIADHFIIGNENSDDGQVQVTHRWDAQMSAGKTEGLNRVDAGCISICLIGDLDQSAPTPAQMAQLNRLVTVLQDRLRIDRERVLLVDAPGSAAGCGRYFPREAFLAAVLP